MNRREMLKSSAAAALTLRSKHRAFSEAPAPRPIPQYDIFEATLEGPATGNPFLEITLSATFTLEHRSIVVDGFYDGNGSYKIRFMPDTQGSWSYTTSSNTVALNNKTGRFTCTAPGKSNHGPVGVRYTHHFAYADGTPYFPFGTTCYAWVHQGDAMEQETLATLRTAPFNKIRMCVFPKHYEYNHNEPQFYVFPRLQGPSDEHPQGINDYTRFEPAFFAHFEKRLAQLREMNIEADLILFHPYDRWGYAGMAPEVDERYLRYLIARLAAYRNVWWSLANEFDLMKAKTRQDFDHLIHVVQQFDPYQHLRSIHYSKTMYDYASPAITHASLQTYDFDSGPKWAKEWNKPIVYDEVQYEGNLRSRWGNLTGEEMTRRFWLGIVAGCYVTHGETYLNPELKAEESSTQKIWWSHGGRLSGSSPQRIGFLRTLLEESTRRGFDATENPYYLNASSTHSGKGAPEAILYYFDFHQPGEYEFPLGDAHYQAELIDPWEMKRTPLTGTYTGKARLTLPVKPYQAIRFSLAGQMPTSPGV
ncbi:MAG: DUF5060 domain-containing protein [Edaphobacter sp.]|uniref:DUF5060 domain-containing protein n=1 Tax=Edaphobacter sp. TaxID=1934404 RepID=UPI00238DC418|nr:DUF5060 domain-containing protein [Edaphobacter sp.]MDE1175791.1 DUF5060 domain-containing protein [Edaphobacter sp.]